MNSSKLVDTYTKYCDACRKETMHRRLINLFWCSECSEKERILQEKEAIEKAVEAKKRRYHAVKELIMLDSGVTRDGLESVKNSSSISIEKVQKYTNDLENNIRSGNSLIFGGTVGTGKTTTAIGVALKAAKLGYSVMYLKGSQFLGLESSSLAEAFSVDLLVFDEMHLAVKKYGTASSSEEVMKLYRIFETRKNRNKSHIVISNYVPQELLSLVGEATFDRIKNKAYNIPFAGESFRRMLEL